MAYSGIELAIHRKSTENFINADPTLVSLSTVVEQMVAGTKKTIPGTTRPEQTFKIIWAYDNGIDRLIGDNRGGVRRFDFILLGNWDSVIEIGDWWQVGDQKFVIEYVFPGNGYEVKAGGISHGPSPT